MTCSHTLKRQAIGFRIVFRARNPWENNLPLHARTLGVVACIALIATTIASAFLLVVQKRERESGNSCNHLPGQQNGQRNNNNTGASNRDNGASNRGAHANTAITTQVGVYSPAIHAPSATTAATTTATSTSITTPSLPEGIGYSFIAAPPTGITAKPINFSMTADSGVSSHFIDNQLLHGIEQKMLNYVNLDTPVTINVACNHRVSGIGKGVLIGIVVDHLGSKRSVKRARIRATPTVGRYSSDRGSQIGIFQELISGLERFSGSTPQRQQLTVLPWTISTSPQQRKARHQKQPSRQLQVTLYNPRLLWLLMCLLRHLRQSGPTSGISGWDTPTGK